MLDYRIFTFIKVCQTLNFTQAARELHITQPAVTKHIKDLENEYQTKLFHFKGKQCKLTDDGKDLLDLLITMNNDVQHFKNRIKEKRQPLQFGATLTIGEYVITPALLSILKDHPKLQIKMLVDNTERLLQEMDNGHIDFAIIEGFFSKEKYDSLRYKKEAFIAVTSPDSPLVKDGASYHFEDLLNQPLIIREEGSGTRDILQVALKEANLTIPDFHQVTEIGNLNTIKALVKNNMGISFLYQSVVEEELRQGSLVQLKLDENPIYHDFTFIWRKGSHFQEQYKEIFDLFSS